MDYLRTHIGPMWLQIVDVFGYYGMGCCLRELEGAIGHHFKQQTKHKAFDVNGHSSLLNDIDGGENKYLRALADTILSYRQGTRRWMPAGCESLINDICGGENACS